MQLLGDSLTFSATDLNNFLACEHLTTLDLEIARNALVRPKQSSGQAEILSRLGEEHERAYLDSMNPRDVVTIERSRDLSASALATENAMAQGAAIIYQATFYDGTWMGHADFLRRVDNPSKAGRWAWHYEVEDTKLARHTEPYFLLQLAYYSEHVARIQGVAADYMYVVLGDNSRHAFRVQDFSAYYRSVKARFSERTRLKSTASYPYPAAHCVLCVWDAACTKKRLDDDHLSLVANISRLQTGRLNVGGITTLAQLGATKPTDRPDKMAGETFLKLARQARLQLEQRNAIAASESNPYKYELIHDDSAHREPRGFALLPAPSVGDVFFDMEGDPYFEIGTGLEYLFGAYTADDKVFRPFWGCDRSAVPGNDRREERRAFEAFVDFVVARRERFPDMHIYHYASYEKTALQKLAIRHGTREDEVDRILREEWLVDLYRVVRQAVIVGQPSYSIKKLEDYYGKRQETAIKAGDDSILQFEEWIALRFRADTRNDSILDDLETYNKYDCISTHGLLEWLLHLRKEAIEEFGSPTAFYAGKEQAEPRADRDRYAELKVLIHNRISEDFDPELTDPRFEPERPFFMMLHMMQYHWREAKPIWWQFHDRCERYMEEPQELFDDAEAIVELSPIGAPAPNDRSLIYNMSFPAQYHKLKSGGTVFDLRTKGAAGTIVQIDERAEGGVLRLRRGPTLKHIPLPTAITIRDIFNTDTIRDGLARFSNALLEGNAAKYSAAMDMLDGDTPRFADRSRGANVQPVVVDEAQVQALCSALDRSYLFIQGPPGSGKTYMGARLILNLVARGFKVGVLANSHKAIHNLLDEVEAVAAERAVSFIGVKKTTNKLPETEYASRHFRNDKDTLVHDDADIVAGTAWAFAAEKMDQRLDYLFIDEAGQVGLPAAIASATSARNVVLLGDPLQLAQVTHTQHPGNVGASVLEHLLGGEMKPVDPRRGVLLTDSYRMHPDVCDYISEVMYEGKLHAATDRERQRVDSAGLSGTGLRFIPVTHSFNRQRSSEEAQVIAENAEQLLQGTVVNYKGERRRLTTSDIIVVTPYNAQVACIQQALNARPGCEGIAVGTVDKFQGREAFVVFYSTAASTIEDASRGLSFVFDRQRVNVAISRARALAIWVGSPSLFPRGGNSIEDARLANGICRFLELVPA